MVRRSTWSPGLHGGNSGRQATTPPSADERKARNLVNVILDTIDDLRATQGRGPGSSAPISHQELENLISDVIDDLEGVVRENS